MQSSTGYGFQFSSQCSICVKLVVLNGLRKIAFLIPEIIETGT